MDAIDALISRVSPAKLAEPGPTPEALDKMLAAAVAAPDHGRIRPWRFIVIEGKARERFGELMAQSLARREKDLSPAKLDFEKVKALRAPVLVVVAAAPKDDPKIPEVEQIEAVAAATQNFCVAAHALGYGTLWRTGKVAYDAEVKKALGLREADTVVGIIYVGSVGTPGAPRKIAAGDFVRRWEG
ncbi:MAG TPA: nitroreductase [Alphaproteobacteria bacterium]|nr:nitroreductase [Alphaproteobacteria bacterium]